MGKGLPFSIFLNRKSDIIAEKTMTKMQYMNECMVRDLASRLVIEKGFSLEDAIVTVFNSITYKKLCDPKSGLYFQSPVYVYWFLEQELNEKNKDNTK